MRSLPALADRPHNQGLAAPCVASRENLRTRGSIVAVVGLYIAARVEIETKGGCKTFMHWRDEAHREEHEIGLDLKLTPGYRLQFLVGAHAVKCLDLAV